MNKNSMYFAVIICLTEVSCLASSGNPLKKLCSTLYSDLCADLFDKNPSQEAKDAQARYQALPLTPEERDLDATMLFLIESPRKASIVFENIIEIPGKSLNRCSRNPQTEADFQQIQSKRCAYFTIASCALCTGALASNACGCTAAAATLTMATKISIATGLIVTNMPAQIPMESR